MRGSEGIVHVIIGEGSQLLGKLFVVRFLLRVKPQIFQKQRLSLFQLARLSPRLPGQRTQERIRRSRREPTPCRAACADARLPA